MATTAPSLANDDDVYATTGRGNAELKAANTGLTVPDLQVLVWRSPGWPARACRPGLAVRSRRFRAARAS